MKEFDWNDLLATSDYLTIRKIKRHLDNGEIELVKQGIDALYEDVKRSEIVDLVLILEKLMENIILWKKSVKYRTGEIAVKIENLREDIDYSIKLIPILNDDLIKEKWNEAFYSIKKYGNIIVKKSKINKLTWDEVFVDLYETDFMKKNKTEEVDNYVEDMIKLHLESFEISDIY